MNETNTETKKKPVAPVYLVGLTWLAYAICLPLVKTADIIIAATLSVIVYAVSSKLISSKRPKAPGSDLSFKKTGDNELDSLLVSVKDYLTKLDALSETVTSGPMADNIGKLCSTGRGIFDFCQKNEVDARQVKKFADYYFPTAIKFIESYAELSARSAEVGSSPGNITETKNKIEGIMGSIAAAFDKQLDNLYEDKALDITTDIEVLKNILRSEGLGGADAGSVKTDAEGGGR